MFLLPTFGKTKQSVLTAQYRVPNIVRLHTKTSDEKGQKRLVSTKVNGRRDQSLATINEEQKAAHNSDGTEQFTMQLHYESYCTLLGKAQLNLEPYHNRTNNRTREKQFLNFIGSCYEDTAWKNEQTSICLQHRDEECAWMKAILASRPPLRASLLPQVSEYSSRAPNSS